MATLQYDFTAFIDRVKDMSYKDMLSAAEKALVSGENNSRGRKMGARARQQGSLSLVDEVGEFIFFLRNGVKPFSVSELNWALYRTPIENLVRKGQMKPSALKVFQDTEKRDER